MECDNVLDGYFKYLRKDLVELKEKGFCKIELPFPRPAGDSIVLLIEELDKGTFLISDEGFIDDYLFSYAIDLWDLSAKRMSELFLRTKKRYNILAEKKPYIAIESTREELYESIFQMSNIMNELASLTLLVRSGTIDIFRRNVEIYLKENNVSFTEDPKVKITLHGSLYSFPFEFKFQKGNILTKVITSNEIVKDWAVNFDQIKRHYPKESKIPKLWALYNDKDKIDIKKVSDFLGDYADQILAWSIDKEKFLQFK